jgi:type III restriction enzyme
MLELNKRYGTTKFIIVVPSVAVKEGVYKSLQITEEIFKFKYDNVPYSYFVYDSSKLNRIQAYSTSTNIEIMIINIDAFRKDIEDDKKSNIIHRENDRLSGNRPIDLIAGTNPIVIIDEPQSVDNTTKAKEALKTLNPLVTLRYSATHKQLYNLMYQLTPVDAYQKRLVKQIEVGSIQTEGMNNQAYISLLDVRSKGGNIDAHVEVDALQNGKIKRVKKWINQNQDLEELTGRIEYEGYIIKDIYVQDEYIDFTSRDEELKVGEAIGSVDDKQIKTALMNKTIEAHLDKELILNPQGIKVLSLFFIDSVSNYRVYDEEGNQSLGEYAKIFEEEYLKLIRKTKYASLFDEMKDNEVNVSKVHNGYFSIDKKSKASNKKEKYEYYKDTSGSINADEDTYNLIMRDKEKLMSFKSKLRFIFSHSALKEGWDNPNVFQICTLKDAGNSEIRRRQEIGRGLRLCVNQDGERVHGFETNTLTVMATESYVDFVDNLQKEIEKDTGIKFGVLESHSFSSVVMSIDNNDEVNYLGQEKSEQLYDYLILKGYIDNRGKVQDLLRVAIKEDNVELPEEFTEDEHVEKQIISNLKDAAGKLQIKNQDDKKRVKVNRQILNSPEFKALWERVKYKTTFAVDFDSESLIKECIRALDDRLKISRGKLHYTRVKVAMSIGGLQANEDPTTYSENVNDEVEVLPDIVGYLQNETQLTRKSIVKILTETNKLNYFKINPQKFIEGCIEIINEQMRLHIIDGIQYKKIGDSEYYSQELFENEELFGYLKSNLKESDKSPYEYVIYDSNIESKLATDFENSDNISVYAKLPNWFKIDTPLGTYNPDWAILWKGGNDEKLYFVVESKGTTLFGDLRPKEQAKIKCGIKHFKEIGSEMIVAENMDDVTNHALMK